MVFVNTALTNNASTLTGMTGQFTFNNSQINCGSQSTFIGGGAGGNGFQLGGANIQIAAPGFGIAQGGFGHQYAGYGDSMPTGILWGPKRDLDYWTAREAGLVPEPERRAMKLFASECDEERFSLYCHLGTVAALGNMTRHLYIVRRYKTVVEVVDGQAVGGWCVVTRDRHVIPETDHVLTLKSLIEGEEYSFRDTGNAVGYDLQEGKVPDPYRQSFIRNEKQRRQEGVMKACEESRQRMEALRWKSWLSYKGRTEQWKANLEPPQEVTREEFQLQELRNQLLMGVGAAPQTAYSF